MPSAWGNHDKRQLFVNVALLTEVEAQLVAKGEILKEIKMFKALIDTGATGTCITKATADKIGLLPIGKVAVHGVSSTNFHNNYLFYIGFTVQGPISPGATQVSGYLHMIATPIEGAEFNAGS